MLQLSECGGWCYRTLWLVAMAWVHAGFPCQCSSGRRGNGLWTALGIKADKIWGEGQSLITLSLPSLSLRLSPPELSSKPANVLAVESCQHV